MTHAHGIHIAVSLADQLHRLHTHPWGFVIGDLSPNNLLVDYTFSSIHFIDLDTIRFTPVAGTRGFDAPGTTPRYRSPEYFRAPDNNYRTATHDDFVLAILLFQILMAICGVDDAHPFVELDGDEEDNIRCGRFPYVDGLRHTQVGLRPAEVYGRWHIDLRTAFEAVFTGRRTMTAGDWANLVARYRRSLR
jgi:DNA-binding helix-hairpin-helix protein with protein kinase domain